jgi:hypothetical protein
MPDNRIGVCTECGEWTTLHESCCGAPIYIEGLTVNPDDEEE